jgi:hypothetical protein
MMWLIVVSLANCDDSHGPGIDQSFLFQNDLIVGICLARLLRQYDGVLVDFVQTFQEVRAGPPNMRITT